MKKFVLLIMLLVNSLAVAFAQDTIVFNVSNLPESEEFCVGKVIVIYAEDDCDQWSWEIDNVPQSMVNPLVIQNQVEQSFKIEYYGCNVNVYWFYINYYEPWSAPSFTQTVWKRSGESITINPALYGVYGDVFLWSTGETNPVIDITEPGVYTLERSYLCGTDMYTFIVQDNVEVYRATVDLASGLNKVTWQTTPEQAEYISQVKVERDGMVVGTVPYEDGQFMDNIGSENAARNYRLTGITTEGIECPIPSYQYGTLHVDYSPNTSNPNKLNMAWTPPYIEEGAPISLSYFQICKYDSVTDEVTVVDQLGANNTIGSYDVNLFDGGYAVVAAMFNEGKDYDERSYSNLTDFLLGIEENEGQQCRVYPNPAKDRVIIEGTGTMVVTNTLGQTVMVKEIDGKETMELPQGLYFVKLGGATRKIVVE